MPSYKLTYFNYMGVAEPIRFLLSYGNIEFEDKRVDRDSGEWKTLKPLTPFGQMPILEVDGKRVCQHLAICRYLAKKVGLNGKNDWEDLQIDIVAETIQDIRTKMGAAYMKFMKENPKADLDAMLNNQKYLEDVKVLIPYWEKLDAIVKENDGYFANKKLSWADLYFVASITLLNYTTKGIDTKKFENLRKVEQNVLAIPAIKKWVEKRPVTLY